MIKEMKEKMKKEMKERTKGETTEETIEEIIVIEEMIGEDTTVSKENIKNIKKMECMIQGVEMGNIMIKEIIKEDNKNGIKKI